VPTTEEMPVVDALHFTAFLNLDKNMIFQYHVEERIFLFFLINECGQNTYFYYAFNLSCLKKTKDGVCLGGECVA
jgi:hypothetical protein